ncbi:centromere protein L [Biomphalaria glabrata]|nr:centromere protein L-like [Biomphalaria glabrata]
MTETPQNSSTVPSKILHVYTPFSARRRTPGTAPYSQRQKNRKLTAPSNESFESVEIFDYSGLLKKTWRLYSLSPLYNFKVNAQSFKKYARSLDASLTEDKCSFASSNGGSERSSFTVYKGLKFNADDPEAVQIQVTEKRNGGGSTIVLNALMFCVDIGDHPVPAAHKAHFTYYPVIMITGNKLRSNVVLNWLERHFDCHTSPLTFSNNDLRWILACCSTRDAGHKAAPVLLQYTLQNVCEGIKTIDCRFESTFCRELWQRIQNTSLSSLTTLKEDDVETFVGALESHLEYTMHIVFSKLTLSEVGTPIAYVSSQGKIKLFQSEDIYLPLHLVSSIANDKLTQFSLTQTKPVLNTTG